MATMITAECISCGACEPECPNNAISQAADIYVIDPLLCTECVGFHDYEACAAVCPVDCCVTDPGNVETEEALIARARTLHKDVVFENFESRFRKGADKPAASAPSLAQTEPPAASLSKTEAPAASRTAEATPPAAKSEPAQAPQAAAARAPAAKPVSAPRTAEARAPIPQTAPPASAAVAPINGRDVPATKLPDMQDWKIPVHCFKCGQRYEEPLDHFMIGNVLWCPHCYKSMVVKDNLNFQIRTTLKDFYEKSERELAEFKARREAELKQFVERRERELKAFEIRQQQELETVKKELEKITQSYNAPGRPAKRGSLFGWG